MGSALEIEVTCRLRRSWGTAGILPAGILARAARHAARAEGFRGGQLSIVVVGAARMATLHARYLHRDGPTDVLTFDLGTDRRQGRLEAEIIVCADAAISAARAAPPRRGRAETSPAAGARRVRAELALYVVHGVLHLAGYADHAPADFRRMHAREDELLEQLGLGAVFAAGADPDVAGRGTPHRATPKRGRHRSRSRAAQPAG
ncbi:MAG: rRNA maturation RNase YbeY [Planctomycetota bacterium]